MRNLVATEEEQVTGFAQTESNPWKKPKCKRKRHWATQIRMKLNGRRGQGQKKKRSSDSE